MICFDIPLEIGCIIHPRSLPPRLQAAGFSITLFGSVLICHTQYSVEILGQCCRLQCSVPDSEGKKEKLSYLYAQTKAEFRELGLFQASCSLRVKVWNEREVGGGIRMGNTCKSMANSCQCMTNTTTIL